MAKKKMTKAQAAAARRPDDWEPPQVTSKKIDKRINQNLDVGPDKVRKEIETGDNRKLYILFIFIFILAAIVTPFIVIGVSGLLGIQ